MLVFAKENVDSDVCSEKDGDDRLLLSAFELKLLGGPHLNDVVIKSESSEQNGSKLRQRPFRSSGPIDNNAAVRSIQCRRTVKRSCAPVGSEKHVLYAFPSFDRSDALLFLPSTLIRHLNTADMQSFSKLLLCRLDKSCEVRVPYLSANSVGASALVQFHSLLNDIHPDAITCVHSTKVIENIITASIYSKFTACNTIYDSVARTVKDPLLMPMFGVPRSASLSRNIRMENRPEAEKNQFIGCSDTSEDLVVHLNFELSLTVDDATKKITVYELVGKVLSIQPTEALE